MAAVHRLVEVLVMRRFGVLSVHPVPTDGRKEVGGEGHECAYCDISLAGACCIRRRRSTGFGRANEVIERFCDRRCRGLFDERGPKDASQWSRLVEERPTHRNTLAPYQDDEGGGGPTGATTETSSASEVQT